MDFLKKILWVVKVLVKGYATWGGSRLGYLGWIKSYLPGVDQDLATWGGSRLSYLGWIKSYLAGRPHLHP